MRFILLCYDDPKAWADAGRDAMDRAMDRAVRLTHDLDANGQYVLASPLHPGATAKTVRVRNGQRVVTDGPFTETREVLGGFYLIDADTIEEALAIAAQHPGAGLGAVEVRPVIEMPDLPPLGGSRRTGSADH